MMKVTELHPAAVLADFPSQVEAVKLLFRKDKTFKARCVDYQQCAKALHYWINSDLPEAPQRQKEYQALLSELGTEISLILDKLNASETNNDRQMDL
jgi:hypothetical protein